MRTFSIGTWKNNGGFTLLEIIVVIFILGLIAVLAYPSLQTLAEDGLSTASRRLAGTVQYLYHQAMATRQVHRLSYDFAENAFRVQVVGPNGVLAAPASSVPSRVSLPPGVGFKDIVSLRQGKVAQGEVFTHFFPSGLVERTVIHLADEDQNVLTLDIHPLTGRVSIYEGYVDVEDSSGAMGQPLAQTGF